MHELGSRIKVFGIPVLHSYGHQLKCQMMYNPRRLDGIGLTDGEGCERFWSLLTSSVSSVRQMRYCVFQDYLSLITNYICNIKNNNLGAFLYRKLKESEKILLEANIKLEELGGAEQNHSNWENLCLRMIREDHSKQKKQLEIFSIASKYISTTQFLYSAHHGTKKSSNIGKGKTAIGILINSRSF